MSLNPAIAQGHLGVVTGAAHGIGLEVTKILIGRGMRVAMLDRAGDALAQAAAELGEAALPYTVDVADRANFAQVANRVLAEQGTPSLLMNNAGCGGGGNAWSNPEGWQRVLGVNVMGVLHGLQLFLPAMIDGNAPGIVINTGSKQGITQPPGDTAYNVSKSAVKSITEGLAHSLRQQTGDRITAHLLIPGFTYSKMVSDHVPVKPAGAWDCDQVAARMMEGLERDEFYIVCQDNETSRAQDEKRMAWAMGDIIENRPALSRWHPDYKTAFDAFMQS